MEDDRCWSDSVRGHTDCLAIKNVVHQIHEVASGDADIGNGMAGLERPYVNAIDDDSVRCDCILIDGIYRNACAARALHHVKLGGVIVVDNCDQASISLDSTSTLQLDSLRLYVTTHRVLSWTMLYTTEEGLMQLSRVILAFDDDDFIREVVPFAVSAWRVRVEIEPTVYQVGNEPSPRNDLEDGSFFEAAPGIPSAFQAQCIRLLLPCLYPDDVVILSDADMVPLSKAYFQGPIASIPEGSFVIYRPFEAIPEGAGRNYHETQTPICYVAASGLTWREIFGVGSLDQIYRRLNEWYRWSLRTLPAHQRWSADQRLLHNYVREWDPDGIRTVRLGDASTRHKRLEVPEFKRLNRQFKSFIAFDPSLLSFTDFHLQPVFSTYRTKAISFFGHLGLRPIASRWPPEPKPGSTSIGVEEALNRPTGAPYATHIAPLVTAILATTGPVLELGAGDFSTPIMHALCRAQSRYLLTADTSMSWLDLFSDLDTPNHDFKYVPVYEHGGEENPKAEMWDEIGGNREWGVVFVDHRPGQRRIVDILRLKHTAQIIVVHDTEEQSYGYKTALSLFLYSYTYRRYSTWTTLVSDTIDVRTLFAGQLAESPTFSLEQHAVMPARISAWRVFPRPLKITLRTIGRRLAARMRMLARRPRTTGGTAFRERMPR